MSRVFRLAGLLRLRKLQEDQAAAALARANARRKDHRALMAQTRGTLEDTPGEVSSATALRSAAAARSVSRHLLADLAALNTSVEDEVRSAQAVLVEAKTASSALEKLAEKHAGEEMDRELHEEQLFLDELSTNKRPASDPDGKES